jgi:hypothetical protein
MRTRERPRWSIEGVAAIAVVAVIGAAGAIGTLGACSTGKEGSACDRDDDCRFGYACGFPIADRCHAAGHCVELGQGTDDCASQPPHAPLAPLCSCDGTSAVRGCGLPDGIASRPVRDPLADWDAGACAVEGSGDGG